MRCILVPGTHAAFRGHDEREWWFPGDGDTPASPFIRDVLQPIGYTADVFLWSTDLDGTRIWPWQWFGRARHIDWESWGRHLAKDLQAVPFAERILLAHSHGGNVCAYAAARVPIRLLVTIATPVRLGDLRDVYERARAHIRQHVHVHSDGSDRMQCLGGFFDGHFGVIREHPYAHENVYLPRRGHSQILNDPAAFPLWTAMGIVGHLQDCLTEDCDDVV